jgi:hypothetical protein
VNGNTRFRPACSAFDRAGLAPAGFYQEVSPSHLRFPLFQVFPSAIFTVPTITFGLLHCFFVIDHDRRKILRFNVTRNPSALWIVQQMREAWPYATARKFLLFDRDSKFGHEVLSAATRQWEPSRSAPHFAAPGRTGLPNGG